MFSMWPRNLKGSYIPPLVYDWELSATNEGGSKSIEVVQGKEPKQVSREPRWEAAVAVLTVGLLYLAVPAHLRVVDNWVPLAATAALAIAIIAVLGSGNYKAAHVLGYAVSILQTTFLMGAVVLLVRNLPLHRESGLELLQSAGTLFPSNIFIFALWYWRIDSGGPYAREIAGAHVAGEFLFPQMTMDPETRQRCRQDNWTPGFVDYLFLAFNTSTALSPADTGALTRIAKVMMMIQASISITILVLLVGRAVNVL